MAKRKQGIGTVEINKKFISFEEASRYAKRLRNQINYICKKRGYQATVMTAVSNLKKEVSESRYVNNGKRERPKKELVIYERTANEWYKGNYHTDWHIHVLIVSNPGYSLRNYIKKYIDKNWITVENLYEKKEFDISKMGKKVYKKKCNIKMLDYFIDQASEPRFISCNYSDEKNFDYTLKDYYSEYMKLKSNKKKLYTSHILKPLKEEKFEKQLNKIERKFKLIEDYFYTITKQDEELSQKKYMAKVRLDKIAENCNKVQTLSKNKMEEDSHY